MKKVNYSKNVTAHDLRRFDVRRLICTPNTGQPVSGVFLLICQENRY